MSKYSYIREIEIKYKKRRVKGKAIQEPITDAEQVVDLFSAMQNETKEKIIAINLDGKMKILCFEVISMGSSNAVYAKPFEALRSAIVYNARAIIIVHNHPSGDPTPSISDIKFTGELMNETNSGGIELLDHIIIGDEKYVSFAEEGLITEFKALLKKSDDKLNLALNKKAKAVADKFLDFQKKTES